MFSVPGTPCIVVISRRQQAIQAVVLTTEVAECIRTGGTHRDTRAELSGLAPSSTPALGHRTAACAATAQEPQPGRDVQQLSPCPGVLLSSCACEMRAGHPLAPPGGSAHPTESRSMGGGHSHLGSGEEHDMD